MIAEPTIDGGPVANPTLIWSSSNPEIVTIDESGNALFIGVGSCAIACHWKEHNVTDTVYVEVVAVPVTLECKIDGPDSMYPTSDTTYAARFYFADGVTEDTTITPIWRLVLPSGLANKVTIKSQAGNTVTLYANSGTQGNDIGLTLTESSGMYSATKTIRIRSWL